MANTQPTEQEEAPQAESTHPSPSHPICIWVKNNSSKPKKNVEILNACANITNKWFTEDGSLIVGGINGIIIGGSIIRYDVLLVMLLAKKIRVGKTLICCFDEKETSGRLDGMGDTVGVMARYSDMSGMAQGVPLMAINPKDAEQKDVYICETFFYLDGSTSLAIDEIPAHATFQIYFYPAQIGA